MTRDDTPRSTLTQIGGWKLGKTLGRGAYAHVRLATHPNGHKAACKILPALHHVPGRHVSWDDTVDAIEAHKEVVLLKALSGAGVPGIVGLEGVIVEGGWTYVFLTLYPASASAYDTPWNEAHFIIFFRRLLYTIDILHRLNISHEDLKRSNVLVDNLGLPAVVDFGFSHFRPNGGFVRSSGGTLDYSSPEKAADDLYEPKANDVWALGILATKLLGIAHPYSRKQPDENSTAVRDRIIEGEARFSFKTRHKAPGGIGELILGMLERDPQRRWTIPRILLHPSLQTDYPDPAPFNLPPLQLSYMHRIEESVVDDLCFLAFINKQFALCETPLKIIQRLHGTGPCWEKRWASMLGAWSKRSEMDWQDIPIAITPLRVRSAPTLRSEKVDRYGGRPLKEIYLTPNVNKAIKPPKTPKQTDREDKENLPPYRPRKSRMYGMKTKEESTSTALNIVKPVVGTTGDSEAGATAAQPNKVPKVKAHGNRTNGKTADNPAKPEKTLSRFKGKAVKNKLVVHEDEADSSTKPPSSTATTVHQKSTTGHAAHPLPLSAVPGSSPDNAILVDSPTAKDEELKAKRKITEAKPKDRLNRVPMNTRSKLKGKGEESGTSIAGKQLNNLHLAPNRPRGDAARRRSPRLGDGEETAPNA
ncbi:uncharacterized protein I303_102757 [Kwoniella dejecticola CBS 10117]|uniref:Protein kinase domain-containing protein n=1 Tax=Kwoniella dejecticola CBS 10117 TaxID=1296121 RepID=A0AAJ8KKQ3_9TREE